MFANHKPVERPSRYEDPKKGALNLSMSRGLKAKNNWCLVGFVVYENVAFKLLQSPLEIIVAMIFAVLFSYASFMLKKRICYF